MQKKNWQHPKRFTKNVWWRLVTSEGCILSIPSNLPTLLYVRGESSMCVEVVYSFPNNSHLPLVANVNWFWKANYHRHLCTLTPRRCIASLYLNKCSKTYCICMTKHTWLCDYKSLHLLDIKQILCGLKRLLKKKVTTDIEHLII